LFTSGGVEHGDTPPPCPQLVVGGDQLGRIVRGVLLVPRREANQLGDPLVDADSEPLGGGDYKLLLRGDHSVRHDSRTGLTEINHAQHGQQQYEE
jgi:hypothetical protein